MQLFPKFPDEGLELRYLLKLLRYLFKLLRVLVALLRRR